MVHRVANRHGCQFSCKVQAQVETRRVPKINFDRVFKIRHIEGGLKIDNLFSCVDEINHFSRISPFNFECWDMLLQKTVEL